MKTFGIIEEDFTNYAVPCMFISAISCTFKCEKEAGFACCHNSPWINKTPLDISPEKVYNMYVNNPITEAIVIGGLEPMLQIDEVIELIDVFRKNGENSPFVIYTGYYPTEIENEINRLKIYCNIVVKFGRYIPNRPKRYDEVLGIDLVSDNQYAIKIS